MVESIALGHLAFQRERDLTAPFVPGIPCVRRVRTDINDLVWRYLQSIADPLIDAGLIREFTEVDNGSVLVLPDGLHVRMKKGSASGETSNLMTRKLVHMQRRTRYHALFPGQSELDLYIDDGLMLDVVYVAGEALSDYDRVLLRPTLAQVLDHITLEEPTTAELMRISPGAGELAADARLRLSI